jgi:signal transduction histidine kinase
VIATDQVLLFDPDPGRCALIVSLLEKADPSRSGGGIRAFTKLKGEGYGPSPAVQAIQGGQATVAVIFQAEAFPDLAETCRHHGLSTLLVVGSEIEGAHLAEVTRGYDAWVAEESVERELPVRVAGLIQASERNAGTLPSIDPRFLALVIHDLRTPLNVIGLTIRTIAQTVPQRSVELDEDLTFLTDNARQIEKMLAQLGDYCRLIEGDSQVSATEIDPRRFLADFLEDRRGKPGSEAPPIRLEVDPDSPTEVSLDQQRVRLALQHGLANAINAAGEHPIRLRSSGGAGRWIVRIEVDRPPPATVVPLILRPDRFERLAGSAAERRGLDLAIAARVSELFGGSARLDVEPQCRTTIVFDWPSHLGSP